MIPSTGATISRQFQVTIETRDPGLLKIDSDVTKALHSNGREILNGCGVVHIFIQHTSASLLIQENADPTAQNDLNTFINLIAPENQPWHTHLAEGPDDTTAHLKAAVLPTSVSIPYLNGKLLLGKWQGLYLVEHRMGHHRRNLVITILGS